MGILRGFVRLRRSAAFLRHFRGQARYPFRSMDEILADQRRRLAAMARFAYDRVPHYRAVMDDLGMRPEDVGTIEDLAAWPIVEGTRVQELGGTLLPGGRPDERWIRLRSGGSTGAPKTIYLTAPSLIASMAHRERGRLMAVRAIGRRTGYREALFAPPEGMHRGVERRIYQLLWAPRFLRVERRYYSLYDDPAATVPELAAFRADHFDGYGSHIARLFQHLLQTGATLPLPRCVTFGSDEMPAGVRRAIEERLGVPVFVHYGAVEALNIGFSCGEGEGLHLNVDLYPLRIVGPEGNTLPAGETGSVILSNLHNRGTVLLNYRIGDRGRLLGGACPCGRTLPRLAGLEGRDDEWVARADGGLMHAQAVRTLFTHQDERVWRYQVVQEDTDRFRATIVPASGVQPEAIVADFRKLFRERFGPATVVDFDFVSEIRQTEGGKVRPFVSRVTA